MTEIEVPDPEEPEAGGGSEGQATQSPYRNLFVPLVVVPALIVIVLVLVFALFGAIAGHERTPQENLRTMLDGGKNERTQAAFSLARQVGEDLRAARDDDPETAPEWGIGPELLPEVRTAWKSTDEEDREVRAVLAMLMAYLDEDEGAALALEALRTTPPEDDPGGQLRFDLLQLIGQLGDPAALETVIGFLGDSDRGLRIAAAGALQSFPGERTREALRGMLTASDLDVRGQAAISLTFHGDASGEGVLRQLVDPSSYELERELDPSRWRRAEVMRYARQRALWALARLHRPEDRAFLEHVAGEEEDTEVRQTALHLLDRWDELPVPPPPPESG
jgi:hypothetical protein